MTHHFLLKHPAADRGGLSLNTGDEHGLTQPLQATEPFPVTYIAENVC